jgi:hypothetical protein
MAEAICASEVASLPVSGWDQPCASETREQAVGVLEGGELVFIPQLRFALDNGEDRLLTPAIAGEGKNISLDPASGVLRGSSAADTEMELLQGMMIRFASLSRALLLNLLPGYAAELTQARTSFRPVEIAGRSSSWRKDDTRLHVDSFPSTPTQGRRILRVFTNINPQGRPRSWRVGEPFAAVVGRYIHSIPGPAPASSVALNLLGLTKSRRSAYDHYMLRLHDTMKADLDYQKNAVQRQFEFSAGSTWIAFTDKTSHAARGGQYALEQTFYLPVDAMMNPAQSPLRILEHTLGRRLV